MPGRYKYVYMVSISELLEIEFGMHRKIKEREGERERRIEIYVNQKGYFADVSHTKRGLGVIIDFFAHFAVICSMN